MVDKKRPSKEELIAAAGKTVPDVIDFNLKILFCGINPGLYTAAVGHHFARPGNRFWPALFEAGFSDRLLSPYEERELLTNGFGITNVVERATAAADELSLAEYVEGGRRLTEKVLHYRPRNLAILGIGAYRAAFNVKSARLGLQEMKVGNANIWILPNTSGLNAHYQLKDIARLFRELKNFAAGE